MNSMTLEKPITAKRTIRRIHISPFQIAYHLLALVPLATLGIDAINGNLTVNPIQYATQHLGRDAILVLTAALAVTPLITLTGIRSLQKLSRPLGLYAFFYASLHMLSYVGVDYGFSLDLLWSDIQSKWYVWIGASAFVILTALTITSFRWWMKRLGKRWKSLHRLVYLAGTLVVIHYSLAVKGNLLRLQGDIVKPAAYALVVIFLLVLRLPPVKHAVIDARLRLVGFFRDRRNVV